MFKDPIKKGLRILSNPKKEFEALNKRGFESVVFDYMSMLVASALLAGIFNFGFSLLKAFYLDFAVNITIQYARMINYTIGKSSSIIFFYLFSGTFLLFFASLVLRVFSKNLRYVSLLKLIFYSMTPVLLFGWFLINPFPLFIWSAFLMHVGIKMHKSAKINKGSIEMRE